MAWPGIEQVLVTRHDFSLVARPLSHGLTLQLLIADARFDMAQELNRIRKIHATGEISIAQAVNLDERADSDSTP